MTAGADDLRTATVPPGAGLRRTEVAVDGDAIDGLGRAKEDTLHRNLPVALGRDTHGTGASSHCGSAGTPPGPGMKGKR